MSSATPQDERQVEVVESKVLPLVSGCSIDIAGDLGGNASCSKIDEIHICHSVWPVESRSADVAAIKAECNGLTASPQDSVCGRLRDGLASSHKVSRESMRPDLRSGEPHVERQRIVEAVSIVIYRSIGVNTGELRRVWCDGE